MCMVCLCVCVLCILLFSCIWSNVYRKIYSRKHCKQFAGERWHSVEQQTQARTHTPSTTCTQSSSDVRSYYYGGPLQTAHTHTRNRAGIQTKGGCKQRERERERVFDRLIDRFLVHMNYYAHGGRRHIAVAFLLFSLSLLIHSCSLVVKLFWFGLDQTVTHEHRPIGWQLASEHSRIARHLCPMKIRHRLL